MRRVAEALEVSRSALQERLRSAPKLRTHYRKSGDAELCEPSDAWSMSNFGSSASWSTTAEVSCRLSIALATGELKVASFRSSPVLDLVLPTGLTCIDADPARRSTQRALHVPEERSTALKSELCGNDFERLSAVAQKPLSHLHPLFVEVARRCFAVHSFEDAQTMVRG